MRNQPGFRLLPALSDINVSVLYDFTTSVIIGFYAFRCVDRKGTGQMFWRRPPPTHPSLYEIDPDVTTDSDQNISRTWGQSRSAKNRRNKLEDRLRDEHEDGREKPDAIQGKRIRGDMAKRLCGPQDAEFEGEEAPAGYVARVKVGSFAGRRILLGIDNGGQACYINRNLRMLKEMRPSITYRCILQQLASLSYDSAKRTNVHMGIRAIMDGTGVIKWGLEGDGNDARGLQTCWVVGSTKEKVAEAIHRTTVRCSELPL